MFLWRNLKPGALAHMLASLAGKEAASARPRPEAAKEKPEVVSPANAPVPRYPRR